MMELICPNCAMTIAPVNVNIATDMAKCEGCNRLYRASELAEKVDLKELLTVPVGSSIQLKQGFNKSIEITAPPQGISGETVGMTIFSIFWLGFVAVWTTFAMMGSIFFALFSIPFWLVGIFMAYNTFLKATATQKITVSDHELVMETKTPFTNKQTAIPRRDIEQVKMADIAAMGPLKTFRYLRTNNDRKGKKTVEMPAVITRDKSYFFFENIGDEEQLWAVRLVRQLTIGNKV